MSCTHRFYESTVPDYDLCRSCGTYRSRAPVDSYTKGGYWGKGHSTAWEQAWNVDMHTENGVSKNRFVIERVESEREAALEIGCAPGRLLYWLKHAASFKTVVGIEPDEDSHDAIRQIGCFTGPLLGGLFPETSRLESSPTFDFIAALDVFEHCTDPEGFLEECERIMSPGGQLFLMLPLADRATDRDFIPGEHAYLHSLHNLFGMLSDVGFYGLKYDCWAPGHDTVSARKA